jgi:hypothetical protein
MKRAGSFFIVIIALTLSISGVSRSRIEHAGSALISPGITSMAFAGNYMVCSGGHALKVFDISNTDTILLASAIRRQTETERIFTHDGYVYVTPENGYPELYSLGSDGILTYLENLDWDCPQDICFRGDTAYVATCWSGFHIYDVTDPENPLELGNYYTMNSGFSNIEVIGNYTILPRWNMLMVFDISNPAYITPIDSVMVGATVTKLIVDRNYAFISWDHWYPDRPEEYGIVVFNVSDIPNIWDIDAFSTQYPFDFYAANEHLYVMDQGIRIFWIYHNYCFEVGIADFMGNLISGNGNKIYISNYVDHNDSLLANLAALNGVDPESLYVEAIYNSPSGVISTEVQGDYAYSVCWPGGLAIVNISNPSAPVLASQYTVQTNSFTNCSMSLPYAFLWRSNGGQIIDVSDPSNPVLIVQDSILSGDDGVVIGDYAYIAGGWRLKIVNISDPANPVLASEYTELENTRDIYIRGGYAYVNDGSYPNHSLKIIDISDPLSPSLTAQIDSAAGDIFVDGDYVYFTSYHPSLLIFNVADPSNPQYCGCYGWDICEEIVVAGDYAFLTADGGIAVLDITDRQQPRYIDGYYLPDIKELQISGDIIYAAATYSLEILRFTPTGIEETGNIPSNFSLSPNYPNPFNAQTTISYSLPKESDISIDIFDIMGRKVETLVVGMQTAGEHQAVWNAENKSSGIYFYRLKAGDLVKTQRCVLLK